MGVHHRRWRWGASFVGAILIAPTTTHCVVPDVHYPDNADATGVADSATGDDGSGAADGDTTDVASDDGGANAPDCGATGAACAQNADCCHGKCQGNNHCH
jgi:hypothetical protein